MSLEAGAGVTRPAVFLDLDGTIIGADGVIPAGVLAAVGEAHERGVAVVVATGRACSGRAQQAAERLSPGTPHVFQAGAVISYPDGSVYKAFMPPRAALHELRCLAREQRLELELYTPGGLYAAEITPAVARHAAVLGVEPQAVNLEQLIETAPVIRAALLLDRSDEERVRQLIPAGLGMHVAYAPAAPDLALVSVTDGPVSKGHAIRYLARQHGLDLRRSVAVGDSPIDRSMLDEVGLPRVVADAVDGLAELYPTVAASHSGGAEEAIRLVWADAA
jgi:HAD superfamily hydrolase (TIGR01484 family)